VACVQALLAASTEVEKRNNEGDTALIISSNIALAPQSNRRRARARWHSTLFCSLPNSAWRTLQLRTLLGETDVDMADADAFGG